jgi:hypothetical protein
MYMAVLLLDSGAMRKTAIYKKISSSLGAARFA